MDELFAAAPPGLNSLTAGELASLGFSLTDSKSDRAGSSYDKAGGVPFQGGQSEIYRANLYLRTPTRILVRLGQFYAAAFSELRKKAGRLEWERFLQPGTPVALRVTAHKSRLYHSDAVAERVAGALGDRLGQPSPLERYDENAEGGPAQLIIVRLVRDLCTISLDSSGSSLHRRGYRQATAKAPLRENLAAGMLLASGWDRTSPLLDPFCGSGTIPIEAALLSRSMVPGRQRRFAFMEWAGFQAGLWEEILQQADEQVQETITSISASDRDQGAVQAAQANAARAGVSGDIRFFQQSISEIEPQGTGWVVTNPPYGKRVASSKDLRNLYARFGDVLRARCPDWKVAVLSSDDRLLNATGLKFDRKISMVNGGVNVRLALGRVD
jgi:putative N6-adenine-specific DNA methylase